MLRLALDLQLASCLDSALESTRVHWRKTYTDASDAEAADPRPWREVLADRKESQR